jgi:uncharacterized protein with ParB-like and HNH nuclease domain
MPRFRDIPQMSVANYSASTAWEHMDEKLEDKWGNINGEIDMNPDYQRGHVWTKRQQEEYIEHVLKGGMGGRDIYWNCPGWMDDFRGPMELVDGKQRINAVLLFLNNKIKAFGYYYKDYTDRMDMINASFIFHVNDLEDRKDVIKWYLDLNSGQPHSRKDIKKAEDLLKELENGS